MDPESKFESDRKAAIKQMQEDSRLRALTQEWFAASCRHRYSYNFTWLGRPIIQYPQDIVAMQEIIWRVRPELIVETGVAHGGSLVFYASMLEMLGANGRVIGIDIDIRSHNREALAAHPLVRRIDLIEGSSTDEATLRLVYQAAQGRSSVLVALDSSHAHGHVLEELRRYAPLVTKGSYLVVFDTVVEALPEDLFRNRPWKRGNSPATAVRTFLAETDRFVVDSEIEEKLLFTVAPGGYLKCVKA